MSRQTFKVEIEVTAEDAGNYSSEQLADDVRDLVFSAVREETGLEVVVMTVTAQ
jgi:hypothetical protein